jgi:hypothetical protein
VVADLESSLQEHVATVLTSTGALDGLKSAVQFAADEWTRLAPAIEDAMLALSEDVSAKEMKRTLTALVDVTEALIRGMGELGPVVAGAFFSIETSARLLTISIGAIEFAIGGMGVAVTSTLLPALELASSVAGELDDVLDTEYAATFNSAIESTEAYRESMGELAVQGSDAARGLADFNAAVDTVVLDAATSSFNDLLASIEETGASTEVAEDVTDRYEKRAKSTGKTLETLADKAAKAGTSMRREADILMEFAEGSILTFGELGALAVPETFSQLGLAQLNEQLFDVATTMDETAIDLRFERTAETLGLVTSEAERFGTTFGDTFGVAAESVFTLSGNMATATSQFTSDLRAIEGANLTGGKAWVAYGKAGVEGIANLTRGLIKDEKAQAAIESAISFAKGVAAIAEGIVTFNPAMFAAAAQYFVAGGMFAAIAGGAGGSKGASGGAGAGRTGGRQQRPQEITRPAPRFNADAGRAPGGPRVTIFVSSIDARDAAERTVDSLNKLFASDTGRVIDANGIGPSRPSGF